MIPEAQQFTDLFKIRLVRIVPPLVGNPQRIKCHNKSDGNRNIQLMSVSLAWRFFELLFFECGHSIKTINPFLTHLQIPKSKPLMPHLFFFTFITLLPFHFF